MQNLFVQPSCEELFDKYGDMVFRAAYSYVKNRQDAEDLAQEVFVSVIRFLPQFASDEHCKAWLLRATSNRAKSFFKSAWQKKTVGIEDDFPTQSFSDEELAVTNAISLLPLKYKEIIYLYYIEGYDTKELARLLKLPQNTVLSRMARGRAMLKDTLKGEFDA